MHISASPEIAKLAAVLGSALFYKGNLGEQGGLLTVDEYALIERIVNKQHREIHPNIPYLQDQAR